MQFSYVSEPLKSSLLYDLTWVLWMCRRVGEHQHFAGVKNNRTNSSGENAHFGANTNFTPAPDFGMDLEEVSPGHGACSISNQTVQLPEPTSDVDTLFRYALGVVKRMCHEPSDLRGIGFQIHKLQSAHSSSIKALFANPKINSTQHSNSQTQSANHSDQISPVVQTTVIKVSRDTGVGPTAPSSNFTNSTPYQTTRRRRSLRLRRPSLGDSSPGASMNVAAESSDYPQTPDLGQSTESPPNNNQPLESGFGLFSPILENSPNSRTTNQIASNQPNSPAAPILAPVKSKPIAPKEHSSPVGACSTKPMMATIPTSHPMKQKTLAVEIPRSHPAPNNNNPSPSDNDPTDVFANKSPEELRHVFADWITSEATPQNEDIRILATYLVSLVHCNLERVRTVLICLDRMIKQFAYTNTWTKAFDSIMHVVSQAIRQHYGNFEFNLRLQST